MFKIIYEFQSSVRQTNLSVSILAHRHNSYNFKNVAKFPTHNLSLQSKSSAKIDPIFRNGGNDYRKALTEPSS